MQKAELIQLIRSELPLGSQHLEKLQLLNNNYPYCQTLQMLICKTHWNSDSIGLDSQIRKTAAYAISRNKLHTYLHNSDTKNPEYHIQEESFGSESQDEQQAEKEILSEQSEKNIENTSLERQILTEAINSSVLLEVEDEINYEDIQSLSTNAKRDSSLNLEEAEEERSFSAWIQLFGGEIEENQSTKTEHQLPERQEFYNAARMAKLSVQENDDLVTETLASIYADQGNFDKAIKAYEKLQLKYPEKRIYFAGRIKEIQIQQKDL